MNFKTFSFLFASSVFSLSTVNAQEPLQSLTSIDGRIQQNLRGQKVSAEIEGATLVKLLNLANGNEFKITKSRTDALNVKHVSYQQYYNDIAVEGAVVFVHSKNNLVQSINGQFINVSGLNTVASLDDRRALDLAKEKLDIVEMQRYYAPKISIINSEETAEPVATYVVRIDGKTSKGLWTIKNVYVGINDGKVHDIEELVAHTEVEADAHTFHSGIRKITTDYDGVGSYRLFDSTRHIHTLDATNAEMANSGPLAFSDAKEITNNSTVWGARKAISTTRLSTTSTGIFTNVGMSTGMFPIALVGELDNGDIEESAWPQLYFNTSSTPLRANNWFHFVDTGIDYVGVFAKLNIANGDITDTITFPIDVSNLGLQTWDDGNGNTGNYLVDSVFNPALDAHWGVSRSFDFYLDKFTRESFDGQGSKIINYMNGMFPMALSQNNAAALPDPYNSMVYGLGDGISTNPFSALDVTGHEYTHLVISNNGNGGLRYRRESGALNESFADMFGASIVNYAKPTSFNWRIGDEIYMGNGYMRSMSNPKARFNPDTYLGQYWVNTANASQNNDNGGVHTNSSVGNYWYYLMAEGGNGVNDNNYTYNVTGIGIEKAEQIAYRTLMEYLTYEATYQDAFEGSLQAVLDLYGSDTLGAEYVTVKNAWYAVGLGEGRSTSIVNNTKTNASIAIYPNPIANGATFTIQSKLEKDLDATIVNSLGQSIKVIKIKKGDNVIALGNMAAGLYNITFKVDGKAYTHKVSIY